MHTPRIRCNYCGRRIPASSVVCPNCQRNPRGFYWRRGKVLVLLAGVLLVILLAYFLQSSGILSFPLNGLQGIQVASAGVTATATFTRAPITVVLVVTPQPATATAPPTLAPSEPTDTPEPSDTPTATATATAVVTLTGSETPTRVVTATPTLIPTLVPVNPPQLQAPTDGEQIRGANRRIALTFTPAAALRDLEWYRVQVDYLDRAGKPVSWCAFTKDDELQFPKEFFDDSSPSVRSFLWRVNVVRTSEFEPKTCDAPFELASGPSQVWTFYWY